MTIKTMMLASMALLLACGEAVASAEYTACRKQEKALRELEADKCSDFTKLLNPSGCIAVQNDLKDYERGKCWKLSGIEASNDRSIKPTRSPVPADGSPAQPPSRQPTPKATSDCAQLLAENNLLKAELARLRAELERLKPVTH